MSADKPRSLYVEPKIGEVDKKDFTPTVAGGAPSATADPKDLLPKMPDTVSKDRDACRSRVAVQGAPAAVLDSFIALLGGTEYAADAAKVR